MTWCIFLIFLPGIFARYVWGLAGMVWSAIDLEERTPTVLAGSPIDFRGTATTGAAREK